MTFKFISSLNIIIQICQIDSAMSKYVVIGASSSVVWKVANESDTDHFTVAYGDGDMTKGGTTSIPRYVETSE